MLKLHFNQDSITLLIDEHTSHVKLNQHLIEFKVPMCGYELYSETPSLIYLQNQYAKSGWKRSGTSESYFNAND